MADTLASGPADIVAGIAFGAADLGILLYAAAREIRDGFQDQAEARERSRPPTTARIQAQGRGTEKSVVNQSGPEVQVVTRADGLEGLRRLEEILTPSEIRARARALNAARSHIERVALGGGSPPGNVTFRNNIKSRSDDIRIDINVLRGVAFTPGERSDLGPSRMMSRSWN